MGVVHRDGEWADDALDGRMEDRCTACGLVAVEPPGAPAIGAEFLDELQPGLPFRVAVAELDAESTSQGEIVVLTEFDYHAVALRAGGVDADARQPADREDGAPELPGNGGDRI